MSKTRSHNKCPSFIPKDLFTCEHAWLRTDRVRRPLEAPYSGPYKVSKRTEKYFHIVFPDGSERTVSIDRLKPAVLPKISPTSVPSSESVETRMNK